MIDIAALVGRLMLGAIFVWSGIGKAMAASATIAYMAKLGLPVPTLAYAVTVAVELGIGILFVLGLLGRTSALVLAAWCIATAVVAHSDFAEQAALIQFYKNVAMCGGFIYAAAFGPGRYSLDFVWRERRGL